MLQSFYDVIEDQKYFTQILFIGNLIKFIWILVLALQVWQKMFFLGLDLTYRKCPRSFFQSLGSRVLVPMWNNRPGSRVPLLESWVPSLSWVPGLTHKMGPGSRVPSKVTGLGSHFSDMPFQYRKSLYSNEGPGYTIMIRMPFNLH